MDQGPPTTSELVLRRRRRADRVREVLDDRVLRPAADGKRLADVALLVDQHEPRLLALAVDDLELVVLTGLVFHEARDDGVVLELSLADFNRAFTYVTLSSSAQQDRQSFQCARRARALPTSRRSRTLTTARSRGDVIGGVRVREAERQRPRGRDGDASLDAQRFVADAALLLRPRWRGGRRSRRSEQQCRQAPRQSHTRRTRPADTVDANGPTQTQDGHADTYRRRLERVCRTCGRQLRASVV